MYLAKEENCGMTKKKTVAIARPASNINQIYADKPDRSCIMMPAIKPIATNTRGQVLITRS